RDGRSPRAGRPVRPRLEDPGMSDDNDLQAEETAIVEPPAPSRKEPTIVSARADARAMASIRRAKGFGGLAGFLLTALAAYEHGGMITPVLTKALIGGIAGYMVAWVAAVTVWRRIIRAELHHSYEVMLNRMRASQAGASQIEE